MRVSDVEDENVFVNLPDIDIDAGNVYDIVVLGQLETENLTFLPLITSVSPGCSDVLGVGQIGDACVRFVHVSPDAGPVDIYLNGQMIAQNISYGTVTEFASVPGADHQVQVTLTGESPDNSILDGEIGVDAGQAYQVTVLGIWTDDDNDDNDLRLNSSAVDVSPMAAGHARIRVVHAVPDAGAVTVSRADGVQLFEGVEFDNATDYAVVDAAEPFGLEVTDDEEDTSIVNAPDLQLQAGMTYDAFVIGQAAEPDTLQILILTAPASILEGAQGTPIAVGDQEPMASPVGEAEATSVDGEGDVGQSPTPVGAAPVTPVLTVEPTPTP
jgi:hypothetical protein